MSRYRYSILAAQVRANMASLPPPTVQPKRSAFVAPRVVKGMPVAVTAVRPRLVSSHPNRAAGRVEQDVRRHRESDAAAEGASQSSLSESVADAAGADHRQYELRT